MQPVQPTKQPSAWPVFFVVAAIGFLAGALVVGAFGSKPGRVAAGSSAQPTASPSASASGSATRPPAVTPRPVPTPAPSAPPLGVQCGPIAADLVTCLAVIDAAGESGLPASTTEVVVDAGSTRAWCAPPEPCISPPADSYWVTFDTGNGFLSIPVYLDAEGWVAGLPGH